ncbi:MAG: PorV/PorQ family protein, partial [Elusimicrobiota bacterium]
MKKFLLVIVWASLFIQFPLSVFSEQRKSGASFLKLGAGARELGLGSAASAISEGSNSLYWNPAGCAKLSATEFSFTHADWLGDAHYDYFGIVSPTKWGNWGISGIYFNPGSQEGRDAAGLRTGSFSASDVAMGLSYAKEAFPHFGLGTQVKYIESHLGRESAKTFALDFGGQYSFRNGFIIGSSIRHLGPAQKFIEQKDPLPLIFSIGVSKVFAPVFLVSIDF